MLGSSLTKLIRTVSPTEARIAGPGYSPFTKSINRLRLQSTLSEVSLELALRCRRVQLYSTRFANAVERENSVAATRKENMVDGIDMLSVFLN